MATILTLDCGGQQIKFEAHRLVAAGYTGRNRAHVQTHIDELAHQGIPAPESFPALYEIDFSMLAAWSEITPSSPNVSGEAEAVLLFPTEKLEDSYVSLGSDFTDRIEECRSIPQSKQQPKPIGSKVWRFRDVAPVWDEITVRSWTVAGPGQAAYQSGKLSQLLAPHTLIEQLGSKFSSGGISGSIMLMGTVPLCDGKFQYSSYFACELEAPGEEKLAYSCTVRLPVAS
jgi:hypothetical protein